MGREALRVFGRKASRAFTVAGLIVGASAMGLGLIPTQAFTLIAITTLSVSPTQGASNEPFTVDATYRYSTCTAPPTPPYTFNFYWDKIGGKLLWSKNVTTCNLSTVTYDTGRSPGLLPPSGAAPGKHTIFVEVFDAAGAPAAPNNSASQPYTLIAGKPSVSVNPTSGTPTAKFSVSGKFVWVGGCPAPRSITFKFYWYKVSSTRVLLWTKAISSCSASVVSTGNSPLMVPPSGLNYPSTFVIQVAAYNSAGAHLGSTYTNTTLYRVLAPAPTPRATASASPPCGLPGQVACPSPTPSGCAAPTAALPPSGPGVPNQAALFALMAVGTVPVGGLAILFSPGFLTRRRWTQIVAFLWISLLLVTATGCAAISAPTAQETPSQAQESPSPSPTPSC